MWRRTLTLASTTCFSIPKGHPSASRRSAVPNLSPIRRTHPQTKAYGVGPACGQILRADDCGGPARVVVGIAHAVAVDVARFQRCAPTAVVVDGRGVAVGVLHACNKLVFNSVSPPMHRDVRYAIGELIGRQVAKLF